MLPSQVEVQSWRPAWGKGTFCSHIMGLHCGCISARKVDRIVPFLPCRNTANSCSLFSFSSFNIAESRKKTPQVSHTWFMEFNTLPVLKWDETNYLRKRSILMIENQDGEVVPALDPEDPGSNSCSIKKFLGWAWVGHYLAAQYYSWGGIKTVSTAGTTVYHVSSTSH